MAENRDNQQENQQQQPQESNIKITPRQAIVGMNLDSTIISLPSGVLSYALNAQLENFDGNQVTYQNEQANELCTNFPAGFKVIGVHNIVENGYVVVWLVNPDTGESEIGRVTHSTCTYAKDINSFCLNLSMDHPILKAVHKLTNCSTEVYWTDGFNERRFIDFNNLPFGKTEDCPPQTTTEVDCNLLSVQPRFSIPQIEVTAVDSDGELIAGTYQFAIQYCNALGEGYTSFYSVTNPCPIQDPNKITLDFNYAVNKSINLRITDIDDTGFFDYVNVAVIKNINNISSYELIDTLQIVGSTREVTYTGQSKTDIRLTANDIFSKFPIYDVAQDLFAVNDILGWDQLTTSEQISYQRIANQITLNWQTWRVDGNATYKDPINAVDLRGYMRDEVYAPELVFLLDKGKQTDGFHIPGRGPLPFDLEPIANDDVVNQEIDDCEPSLQPQPRWKVYNTGCIIGYEQEFQNFLSGNHPSCLKCPPAENIDPSNPRCYVGPHQYGCFAYWESTETYPCNEEVWGELAGTQIRHHKFPDSLITHIHDNQGFIYPIGFKVDVQQVIDLIRNSNLTAAQKAAIKGFKIVRGNRATHKSVKARGLIHNVGKYDRDGQTYYFPNFNYNDLRPNPFLATKETLDDSGLNVGLRLDAFSTEESRQRVVLHSPDTHFYQPTLGNILKLETAEFGKSQGHFVQVKKHSRYKFLSAGTLALGLGFAVLVGAFSASVGIGSTQVFDGAAAFTAYNTFIDIVLLLTPKKNFAYQFNSVGQYTDFRPVENTGNKQRRTDIQFYLTPGMQGAGDLHIVNNFERESSVYLRTTKSLPFVSSIAQVPQDTSRYINSEIGCGNEVNEADISSYYATIKTDIPNQYGQIYSYDTVDTGFQMQIDINKAPSTRFVSVFGGDAFINRFAYKSKLPFFLDNRVGVNIPDEADIEYNEVPNVANPIFWFSTDIKSDTAGGGGGVLHFFKELFGVKINNFDCIPGGSRFYQKGKIYIFAYGIPYFYCESEVNVDLRGAFNQQEGDFYPRVGAGIPDDWLQEINTTILQDNTYHYNRSYSKQNNENLFTHLPVNFSDKECRKDLFFRTIFSEEQEDVVNYDRNNWLIYKPSAYFDFPRNHGRLVSIEAIEDRQVLVRFENKTLLYNALAVTPNSVTEIFTGNSLFLKQVPPQDLAADNDLGFMGTQHKLFMKTEYGHVTLDAKRGQVFLIPRRLSSYYKPQTVDLSNVGMSKFFTESLDFSIKKVFPDIDIDNHFKGIGLTGVYDSKYNRIIITKLDYQPLVAMSLIDGKFFVGSAEVELGDPKYFCNKSFTISYDFDSKAWVSFHSYLPNYYVGESNYFYSGENAEPGLWRHNTNVGKFNNFYGKVAPYALEFPYSYPEKDEILHSIEDYTKVLTYVDSLTFAELDDAYFNKAVAFSNQSSSGILELVQKPKNNLNQYMKYPIYNTDSKTVTYTKSDDIYRINTFWNTIIDPKQPVWKKSCTNISVYKDLNQTNHNYGKRSFNKAPIRSRDLKLRYILDNRDDIKLISQFLLTETQKSHK